MIKFGPEICADFDKSSSREWLETNGIGGFACSTISGANTRRYHGLLTAAAQPPLGRVTMLSKFEESVTIDDQNYELSSNEYPDTIYPAGYRYLTSFRLDPFPIWIYSIDGIEIVKKLFMVYGENATVVKWSVLSRIAGRDSQVRLNLKPLLSFVDYHSLQQETPEIDGTFETEEGVVSVMPYNGMSSLFFTHNSAELNKTGNWYRNFVYRVEKSRGFDYHEDLFQPFEMDFDLSREARIVISAEHQPGTENHDFESLERERRNQLIEIAKAEDDLTEKLVLAADQFIVSRGEGNTIIAGYPWFSDWGRDSMIALRGLTLSTNREGIAKNILREYAKHISKGMIPNRFPDYAEEPEYNTVDATLWYIEAVRGYVQKTVDYDFVKEELYEKLAEIIFWHRKGTRFNIHLARDGLIFAGEDGLQLTWMDAKYGDQVFTPRIGKPVEIQALWYNALKTMLDFANRFKDAEGSELYESLAKRAKKSFNAEYWNDEQECLYDVIDGKYRDASVRPNQIFAVSLKHSMLSMYRAKKVVQKVESELFTPVGLRSLSPNDERYRGVYQGSPHSRDSAYHQGTAWAWLMGAFLESVRRTYPKGRKSRRYIEKILEGFSAHLEEEGIGQISEIFDGDPPHIPRGCFAQAWSVAEILRVLK